jgi:hypothetical protein
MDDDMSESSPNHDAPTLDHHRSRPPRGAVLAAASIAQFMVVLDVTIINVALPLWGSRTRPLVLTWAFRRLAGIR